MNTDRNKIVRNMIGKRIGSSVASWKLLNGEEPYKELSGLVLKEHITQLVKINMMR